MKRKIIAFLMTALMVALIVMFSGCIDFAEYETDEWATNYELERPKIYPIWTKNPYENGTQIVLLKKIANTKLSCKEIIPETVYAYGIDPHDKSILIFNMSVGKGVKKGSSYAPWIIKESVTGICFTNEGVDIYFNTFALNTGENLREFLQSSGITTEGCMWGKTYEGRWSREIDGIKISYSDFLREEETIISLLEFNKTVYQKYRPLILNEFLSDPERRVVPYEEFIFPQEKIVTEVEKKYSNTSINDSNIYLLNEEELKKDINNTSTWAIWIWLDNKGITYVDSETKSKDRDLKFEDAFLKDIEKEIGKSNPTPKEIFEKTVIVIEKRLEYDHEKRRLVYDDLGNIKANVSLSDFHWDTECYEYGKGVCGDYARILEEAWRILKVPPEYSEKLKGIDVYYISGNVTGNVSDERLRHAFNVIVSDDQITFVDLTYDDGDNVPIEGESIRDLNAVDKFHYCSVRRWS